MKLSIITVNYNDINGLRKTMQSVICQDFRDYEYIIIDGASTDGSVDVIKEFENHISYWVSEPDNGIYNAMNKAIDVAHGEYCIFMNAGDAFCCPNTLSNVFAYDLQECIVCGTLTINGKKKAAPEQITLDYLFSTAICHQTAFIQTALMRKYKYDESYRIVSDRKFFLQALILDNCSYKSIPVDIVDYDIYGFSAKNPFVSRTEYDKVLEELFPYRIRLDYGKRNYGLLYGDTSYDKLFSEIKIRKYKNLIYTITVIIIRIIAVIKPNAKFIKSFPLILEERR